MASVSVWRRLMRFEPDVTIGQWIYDRIANNWPWLLATVGGSAMSYLASISKWIEPWGPVGWGAAGLISGLLLYLLIAWGYLIISRARQSSALAKFAGLKASSASINTLAPTHTHEKIELSSFYHPFFRATENVRFEDCDLMGPSLIVFQAGALMNSHFFECEVVILRRDRPVRGVTLFRFCTINRCNLYRVTLAMSWEDYQRLPPDFNLPIISDGTIGDA
jgi:hypothetical protein